MNRNPLLDETWRIKDALARKHHYDVHAMAAALMERQRQPDPVHPIVHDVSAWVKEHTADAGLILREKPPESRS